MGKAMPSASEYLLKDAQALGQLYPEVCFSVEEAEDDWAQLVFREGCLGGWGKHPWGLATSLGLTKEEVCSYCQEAFSVWAEQLRLQASIGPDRDESCRLVVIKE